MFFPVVVGGLHGLFGGLQVVFPQGDLVLGGEDLFAAAAAEQFADDFRAVGGVEDGEVFFQTGVRGFFAQDFHS